MPLKRKMDRIAVLPTKGIGDALVFSIASHQLCTAGCEATLFHNTLPELSSWFPGQDFQRVPKDLLTALSRFDTIIVENDNSPLIAKLRAAFPHLGIWYPTYSLAKHGPLSPRDQVFNPDLSMADNIALVLAKMLSKAPEKTNGIQPPVHLTHRRDLQRVLIHPTSSVREKNWLPERFLALAEKLGKHVMFCVSPQEREAWRWVEERGFALPLLPTLADLATLIYESHSVIGNDSLMGHLASNLAIPSVIIADNPKRMQLWQPGWLPAQLVFPPFWATKSKKWQKSVSVRAAWKAYQNLLG